MSRPSGTPADWQRYMAHMATITPNASLAGFYGSAWPAADTPLEEVEFVALDVETTGLDVRRHAIVSVGLIPMSLARIRSDQAWHQIIRPARDLAPESVAFHHITDTDVSAAPHFSEILDTLLEHLAGRVAVVHYHPIERGFIDLAVRHTLGESLLFPLVDTMQLEARLLPRRKPGWLMRMLGHKPVSIRLAACRERYGLPTYRAHHALTDALATAELLQAQIATHYSGQHPVQALWL